MLTMQVILALNGVMNREAHVPSIRKHADGDGIGFTYKWTIDCVPSVVLMAAKDVSTETVREIEGVRG